MRLQHMETRKSNKLQGISREDSWKINKKIGQHTCVYIKSWCKQPRISRKQKNLSEHIITNFI